MLPRRGDQGRLNRLQLSRPPELPPQLRDRVPLFASHGAPRNAEGRSRLGLRKAVAEAQDNELSARGRQLVDGAGKEGIGDYTYCTPQYNVHTLG